MTSTKHTGPITPENSFEVELKVVPKTVLSYITPSDLNASDLLKSREAKDARLNSVIERNKEMELRVWNELIKPIVESYDLKSPSTGKLFQYKFFPKDITARDVDFIIRETMILCDNLSPDTDSFSSPDHKSYSIVHQVIGPLLIKENREVTKKNGKKTNLKIEFFNFLITLFPSKLNYGESPRLPEFLIMLNRETELAANPATGQPERSKADLSSSRVGTDEANQGLAPQATASQSPPEPQHDTVSAPAPTAPVKTSAVNFFTREGTIWHIGFEGRETRIKHLAGLQYIGYLLEKPGTSISCRELYQALSGIASEKTISEGAAIAEGLDTDHKKQAVSDYEATQLYRKQWQKLQDDIDNAEDNPEGEMVKEESKKEQDEISPFLKERTFTDKDRARFQSNVSKRLATAYAAIRKAGMGEMAKHLEAHIKPDGSYGLNYTGTLTWEITL